LIVVDAAAVVDYLLAREPAGSWVGDRLSRANSCHAPHVVDFECASALRRLELSGELASVRGSGALADLRELPLVRYPAAQLLDTIWALRSNLTAYDAAYVALAELLEVPLITTDVRLARSTGHTVEILTPV
jgi:predicted nucleic acid-binding protein